MEQNTEQLCIKCETLGSEIIINEWSADCIIYTKNQKRDNRTGKKNTHLKLLKK